MPPVVKNPPTNAGDLRDNGFHPWVRKTPRRRAWHPTPVFLPENPMDRGVWWSIALRVAESNTEATQHTHTHGTKALKADLAIGSKPAS